MEGKLYDKQGWPSRGSRAPSTPVMTSRQIGRASRWGQIVLLARTLRLALRSHMQTKKRSRRYTLVGMDVLNRNSSRILTIFGKIPSNFLPDKASAPHPSTKPPKRTTQRHRTTPSNNVRQHSAPPCQRSHWWRGSLIITGKG